MLDKKSFMLMKSVKEIDIKSWGDSVYIRKLSAGERITFLKELTVIEGKNVEINTESMYDTMVKVAQLSLCDKDGNRWFDDSQESFDIINGLDADAVETISDQALLFNGLGTEPEKEALKN